MAIKNRHYASNMTRIMGFMTKNKNNPERFLYHTMNVYKKNRTFAATFEGGVP